MKSIVCYSSKTGNTKKIAEKIYEINPFEKEIIEISRQANNIIVENYELLIIGYWVENNNADRNTRKFLKNITNKTILLFGTMGTDISHPFALKTVENIENYIDSSNILAGHFVCRGEISESVFSLFENLIQMQAGDKNLQKLYRVFKNQYPGSIGRPNNYDLENAKEYFSKIFSDIRL